MFKWIMDLIRPKPTFWDTYFDKFIMPHWERGLRHGIPEDELNAMFKDCVDNSYLDVLPGISFRDAVDNRINGKDNE